MQAMKSSISANKTESGARDGFVFTLLQDLRYGLRILVKKRSFAVFALITLAVGIGVNTAVFSMVNAVLLQSLPYAKSNQICIIWSAFKAAKVLRAPATGPELVELKARSRTFQDFAAISVNNASLTGKGEPEQIKLGLVSANFFNVLAVAPKIGRSFLAEEEGPGTSHTVILSDGFWRRRFGADPNIAGQSIEVDGQTYNILGVMPRDFHVIFPPDGNLPTDIQAWTPFPYKLAERPRAVAFLRVIGRLSDHANLNQAQQELDTIATQLRSQFGEFAQLDLYLRALPLQADVVKDVKPTLLALFAAVGLVLLIACVNVANLLLTLANGRIPEVTVRSAVGAPRSRIIRQLLTESVLLAGIAGVLGFGLAWILVQWLLIVWPSAVPPIRTVTLDFTCLAFTFGLSLVTGIVFGLAPAISVSKINLSDALKEMTRTKGTGRQALRKALVLSEVTFACVLLIGSGLMIRTFVRLVRVDPGFASDSALTFKINLPPSRYPKDAERMRFLHQLEQNLGAVPGVKSVALTSHVPFDDFPEWIGSYWPENPTAEQQQGALLADQRAVSADFFRNFGGHLVAGREFTEMDNDQHPRVAIVDESLARQLWPNENPLGKKLSTNVMANGSFVRDWSQVVGVAQHIKFHTLTTEVRPQIYLPYLQTMPPRVQMAYTLQMTGDPGVAVGPVRVAVAKLDKDLPISGIRTLDQYVNDAKVKTRFITLLSGVLAVVALLLACIGIYGVTSYSIVQRTAEIGMRMALGAEPRHVLLWVLRDTLLVVVIGIILGAGLSFGLAPLLSNMLFQVKPGDPITFMAVSALLFVVAFLGCFFPALRASRMNPVAALRME
jgi:putative ABC transport system permease protein